MENEELYKSKSNPIILFVLVWLFSPFSIASDVIKILLSKDESEYFMNPSKSNYWKLKAILALPLVAFYGSINQLYALKMKGLKVDPVYQKEDLIESLDRNTKELPYDQTIYIDAPINTGDNSKLYFIGSQGQPADTETIVCEYLKCFGLNVLRTEVSFWQAMATLAFWDEIYDFVPKQGHDIPQDIFSSQFYEGRKLKIDSRHEYLIRNGILIPLRKSIKRYSSHNYFSRLVEDQNRKLHISDELIDTFLQKTSIRDFCFITYTIVQDFNSNRAGLPDFVAWDENNIFHIEAKRFKEKIRNTQNTWFKRFNQQGIRYKIIRVNDRKS